MASEKKTKAGETIHPHREAELARRNTPKSKSVTPSRPIERGSTTPGRGWVEPA